jgi:hypothetical protein
LPKKNGGTKPQGFSSRFYANKSSSLKRRSLFFTSSPNSREDLLVKTFHSAIAPFHL